MLPWVCCWKSPRRCPPPAAQPASPTTTPTPCCASWPRAIWISTLSLLPYLLGQAIEIQGMRLGINYGLNRVRFTGPLPAGSRVRARFRLDAGEDIPKGGQTTWNVTLECEGEAKPVLVAEWITRRNN